MCGSLADYDFILWHREWTNNGAVSDEVSDKVFLSRIDGHSSPGTGNHFILWVFDFLVKQIKVFTVRSVMVTWTSSSKGSHIQHLSLITITWHDTKLLIISFVGMSSDFLVAWMVAL